MHAHHQATCDITYTIVHTKIEYYAIQNCPIDFRCFLQREWRNAKNISMNFELDLVMWQYTYSASEICCSILLCNINIIITKMLTKWTQYATSSIGMYLEGFWRSFGQLLSQLPNELLLPEAIVPDTNVAITGSRDKVERGWLPAEVCQLWGKCIQCMRGKSEWKKREEGRERKKKKDRQTSYLYECQ